MSNRLKLNNSQSQSMENESTGEIEINFLEIIHLLVKRKKMITGMVLAVMILTAAYTLTIDNYYRSTTTILPSGKTDRMSELKSLAGFGGGATSDENSSMMFPVVLASRHIREAVLDHTYDISQDGKRAQMTLKEYLGSENPDRLLRAVGGMTFVSTDKVTGVIRLTVETENPELSREIAKTYLAELEKFNSHTRRSRARDKSRYLEGQITQTRTELDTAQSRLESFRRQNSNWAMTTNPEILRQSSQLELDVEIKTKAYLYLSQEYESAKQEVLNDIPVVRVLDEPNLPVDKAGPKRSMIVLMVGIMAFMGIVAWIFGAALFGKLFSGQDEEVFEEIKNDLVRDLPLVNRLKKHEKIKVEA